MSIPVYQVKVPEYQVDVQPDFKNVGAKIDRCIIKHFLEEEKRCQVPFAPPAKKDPFNFWKVSKSFQ